MLPPVPDSSVIDRVRQILLDTSNPNRISDAWRVLADNGDSYADDAAAVTTLQPQRESEWMFHELVRHHWDNIVGADAYVTIQNWYSGSANRVELFFSGDGKVPSDAQVDNLVQAMAAFLPPAPGETTLQPVYQTALAPAIAANWQ